MSTRLRSLELEAFRGFAEARVFDLDAEVVIIHGDNGSGKTSLVDGLVWLLTGAVPRLDERMRGRRRGDDPLVNVYTPGAARVRLELIADDSRLLAFERIGTSEHNTLSAWEGEAPLPEADALLASCFGSRTAEEFTDAVETLGVLQQHAVSEVLSGGAGMHRRMSAVIGLERVTHFTDDAGRAAKDARREAKRMEQVHRDLMESHTQATATLAEAEATSSDRATAAARLQRSLTDACTAVPAGIVVSVPDANADAVAQLGQALTAIVDLAQEVARHYAEVVRARDAQESSAQEAETELAAAVAHADEALEQAPLRVQLATVALELLDDACPVCGQAIDEASVRAELTVLLARSQAAVASAAAVRETVGRAQARAIAAQAAEQRQAEATDALRVATQRLSDRINAANGIKVDASWLAPSKAVALTEALVVLRRRLREAFAEALRTRAGVVARSSAEVAALRDEVQRAEIEWQAALRRGQRTADLANATKHAARRIAERALERLDPSFAEVFDRLAPHPTFTELHTAQDIFYGSNQIVPEAHDPRRGVTVSPQLTFSEGQLNVVALSYFLGLALNAGEGTLPFVVLDDPLQAMDVLAILGFADLCRRVRKERQLLLTTHDRRFASLLNRKLIPRERGARTVLYEFGGWSEAGPRITLSEPPLADVIPLLPRRTA